jgi:hypothetical protein
MLIRTPSCGLICQRMRRVSRTTLCRSTPANLPNPPGANFAGHYRLTSWGCGTSCLQWAIIDVKSGRVFHPANLASTDHVNVEEALFEDGIHAVHLRPDSRLLVVIGGINEDPKQRGISWFVWDGKQLKRIRFVAKPYGNS